MSGQPGLELRIDLLGGFCVGGRDGVVPDTAWRLRKARTLLKLLALAPDHSVHRDRALDALWPSVAGSASANNLRQAVFAARRAIGTCGDDGSARIDLTHGLLTLRSDGLVIDAEEFDAAAREAQRSSGIDDYERALALYGGELLPEDRFEEWAIPRRQELHERYLALLLELAALRERAGDAPGALDALQRALVAEPLHERAHRELMRLYAATGRRQRALAQFHVLRESLRREFADEPDDATRRLYQDILTRRSSSPAPAVVDTQSPPARGERSTSPRARGLPLALTRFIGRERELQEIIGLARRHRLLTLSGPGGCGKTRLALQTAATLAPESADGVWLVELAALSDASLVPSAVASVLGVENRSSRSVQQAVAAHIVDSEMVIVLDNCEHLVAASAQLAAALLTTCPNLKLLATSREPLHVPGEVNWRVPSLSPREAILLFADRAGSATGHFELTDANEAAVAEICGRVDGIPLAIELAAARVGVLAPEQIAGRLRDSLNVLAATRRAVLSRQQTLVATLDWSHALLADDEQTLFRRLGVFAGSFDLDAVEDVCGGELECLARLVDKSLVSVEHEEGVARYRLLDTVRHYARERLKEAGEQRALQRAHWIHYVNLAHAPESRDVAEPAHATLTWEVDELRLAMRSALREEPDVALRLAADLWRFWHDRGDRTEGAGWLEAALAAAPGRSAVRARALHGLSVLCVRTNQPVRALQTASEAVEYFRFSDDVRGLSEELHHLGTVTWVFADFAAAIRNCEEARRLAAAAGEDAIVASVLHTLGVIECSRGRFSPGRELLAQGLEQLRDLDPDGGLLLFGVAYGYGLIPTAGARPARRFLEQTFVTAQLLRPQRAIAFALCDQAAAARDIGEADHSVALLEESLTLFRALGDELGMAGALTQLGNLLSLQGEHHRAGQLHAESLAIRQAANDARGIGLSLLAIAVAAGNRGDMDDAVDSAERALALFERTDDGPGRASAVSVLGYLAADAGRLQHARELQERALGLWRAFIPLTGWSCSILLELAELDAALGDDARVPERLHDALLAYEHAGDLDGAAYCRQALRSGANAVLTAE